jgi:hypothetical protein
MTTTPQVTIYNAETGEEITRDANAAELAQLAKDAAEAEASKAIKEQQAAEKAALLNRLGLTEDELKTILG